MEISIGSLEIFLYIAFLIGVFSFIRLSKTKFGRYEKMHPITAIFLSLVIPVIFVGLYVLGEQISLVKTVFMVCALVFVIVLISTIFGGNKK